MLCISFLVVSFLSALAFAHGASASPADALCGFIAATNIEQISGYSQWSCNSSGYTNSDPCEQPLWAGVRCSDGQVDSLEISQSNLNGTLASSLSGLVSLTSISITGTVLYGSIPSSLGSLGQLEVLHLNTNLFTGLFPSSLGSLTELQYLWLYGNLLNFVLRS